MSTLRNPVGPQPASVYWRRRLVVGLGLLAVIVVVILIVVRPGSGAPTPTPSPSASSSSSVKTPSNTPAAGAGAADAVKCDPAKITVDPVMDATEFQAGANPQLGFTVKSTMTEPCVLAAGSDLQVYTITSGDEVIWISTDCQEGGEAAEVVLQPGVPKDGPRITWDRTRSSPDTCDSARDAVTAEGASYHLSVAIGDIESSETRQFQLY